MLISKNGFFIVFFFHFWLFSKLLAILPVSRQPNRGFLIILPISLLLIGMFFMELLTSKILPPTN